MPYFVTSEEPGGAEVLAMAETSEACHALANSFRTGLDESEPGSRIREREGLANVRFGCNPRLVAADDSALANAVAVELARLRDAADQALVGAGVALASAEGDCEKLKREGDALRKSLRESEAAALDAFQRVEQLQARNDNQSRTINTLSESDKRLKSELAGMESKYRAESLQCNRLLADGEAARDTIAKQANAIASYREQRDAEAARAVAANTQRDAAQRALIAEKQAHGSLDKATRPLMAELGGLTLSMLPMGAYGGALAMAYSEARDAFTVATPGERAAAFRGESI